MEKMKSKVKYQEGKGILYWLWLSALRAQGFSFFWRLSQNKHLPLSNYTAPALKSCQPKTTIWTLRTVQERKGVDKLREEGGWRGPARRRNETGDTDGWKTSGRWGGWWQEREVDELAQRKGRWHCGKDKRGKLKKRPEQGREKAKEDVWTIHSTSSC